MLKIGSLPNCVLHHSVFFIQADGGKSRAAMLHLLNVVAWAVTPTSLFALLGLFYWQLSENALLQNRALSSPLWKVLK